MGPMKLDALEAAVAQLEVGLAKRQENPSDELLRDGVIQRFEYTYEASWKALKRYIQTYLATAGNVDEMSLQDLIRTGNEAGLLLSDWSAWKEYRAMRGATSHIHDGQKAAEVFAVVPGFLAEARHLLGKLRDRV
jgi:nucleotidyltransferase substrate binding protein (TIGR01987 family)